MFGVLKRTKTVYPRWRGELFPRDCDRHRPIGLSPLARGTLYKRGEFMETVRFIPAGAGNSGQGNSITIPCPVYPRWRGELSRMLIDTAHHRGLSPLAGELVRQVAMFSAGCGLSPLARGTPLIGNASSLPPRFIPAGAGNSPTHCTLCRRNPVYPRWRGELFIIKIHFD